MTSTVIYNQNKTFESKAKANQTTIKHYYELKFICIISQCQHAFSNTSIAVI
jgi:hypothetical protein